MLKNRRFAWAVTVGVIVLSIFVGVITTYMGKRNEVAEAFYTQILPVVDRAANSRNDLLRLEEQYLDTRSDIIFRSVTVRDPDEVHALYLQILQSFENLVSRLDEVEMSNALQDFYAGVYVNFREHTMIIRQAEYNLLAADFNRSFNQNLGFIARPFVRDLPIFE